MPKERVCRRCGTTMREETVEHRYDECGLAVTLSNVPALQCEGCGARIVRIPAIEQLHRVIADAIIRRPGRLFAKEVKYLRKFLGYSNRDFAKIMGVEPETSSRWASGKLTMDKSAERLLRLLVATGSPVDDYSAKSLLDLDQDAAIPFTEHRFVRDHEWRPSGAAA